MGKRWGPVGTVIGLVLIGGAFVEIFGWLAVLVFAIVNLAAVIPLALHAGQRERAATQQREEVLDKIMAGWREGQR